MKLNVKQAAISLGATFGTIHLVVICLILLTAGSILRSMMLWHGVQIQYTYAPISAVDVILGAARATMAGALIGAFFAVIWNALERIKNEDQ